jgi:predicted site-specific integrase-resolvase
MVKDLTLAELARITRRHPETLRRLARTGQLPGVYRLGGRWMIAPQNARRLRRLPDQGPTDD